MDRALSRVFTVLMAVVMLGVIFAVLTDSRNSIIVKEMFYVAGGAWRPSGRSVPGRRQPVLLPAAAPGFRGGPGGGDPLLILRHHTGIGS